MIDYTIRPIQAADQEALRQFMTTHWYDERIIAHGMVYYPHLLPGFIAVQAERWSGVITYSITAMQCEIISLNSLEERRGIARSLIEAVSSTARQAGCTRLWLITTNDNIAALYFYQKRGFQLVAIHRNAIQQARLIKPNIPLLGHAGIPIQDEIELELNLLSTTTFGTS